MSTEPNQATPEVLRNIMNRNKVKGQDLPRDLGMQNVYAPPAEREKQKEDDKRLTKLANRLDGSRLENIFADLKELPYGDFMKFCETIQAEHKNVWDGACKSTPPEKDDEESPE